MESSHRGDPAKVGTARPGNRAAADRAPKAIVGRGGLDIGRISMTGSASAYKWQPWLPRAGPSLKIEILHTQVDLLKYRINELSTRVDQAERNLKAEINEAEDRIARQVRQLELDIHGERTQGSQVDARGFGPIAFGIILAGIPDELAGTSEGWLGWLVALIATWWIICVAPQWLRDFRQALEESP
jgi:hypothetical protein